MSLCALDSQKPEISYPLFWEYKIIINSSDDAKSIASECLGDRSFKLASSKTSGNGHYKSYNLAVFVCCDDERLDIFNQLKKRCKFVI